MVAGIIGGEMLKRIPRQSVAAVVVDGLYGTAGEEPHSLTSCEAGCFKCNTGSKGIEEESFKPMVVKSTECVGYIEAVVTGVEGC